MVYYEVSFPPVGRSPPYIGELIGYECNGVEGWLEFDGYYYVNDDNDEESKRFERTLPTTEMMYVKKIGDIPPVVTYTMEPSFLNAADGTRPLVRVKNTQYDVLEDNFYNVEFYKREKIVCTNSYSTINEPDGSEMNVCFFPTDRQKLYFRVVETIQYESSKNTTQVGLVRQQSFTVDVDCTSAERPSVSVHP